MSVPAAKPTRQQLDELDALLQRMLSLPTNQVDANLPPPPPPMPPAPPVEPPQMTYAPPLPVARPAPPPPPPMPVRRAAPPTGDNAWNVPLPAGTGGAAFSGWPVGIEALTQGTPSAVAPRSVPLGRLNVTPIPVPQPAPAMEAPPPPPPPMVPPPRPAPMPAAMPAPAMSPPVAMPQPRPIAAPLAMPMPMPVEAGLPFYLWPLGLLDTSLGGICASFGPVGRWFGQGSGKVLVGWAGLFMIAAAATWGVMDYMGWSW